MANIKKNKEIPLIAVNNYDVVLFLVVFEYYETNKSRKIDN